MKELYFLVGAIAVNLLFFLAAFVATKTAFLMLGKYLKFGYNGVQLAGYVVLWPVNKARSARRNAVIRFAYRCSYRARRWYGIIVLTRAQ